jgi:hypothetical protein
MNSILQPVILRIIIYVMSPIMGAIPAAFLGYVHLNSAYVLSIDLPGLGMAVVAGAIGSFSVFAKWGIKPALK